MKLPEWGYPVFFRGSFLACLSFPFLLSIYAQEPPFQDNVLTFSQYSFADGLPFNPNSVVYQDKAGYMWFGSEKGLCRYNGYAFEYFGDEPQKPNALSDLTVYAVYEDEEDRLWIGTGKGLNCLDKWRENCEHFFHDPANPETLSSNDVTCFARGTESTLWIGTAKGLNRLDLKTKSFKRIIDITGVSGDDCSGLINAIYADESGNVWLGTEQKTFCFNSNSGIFSKISSKSALEELKPITAIKKSSSGKIWVSRLKNGMSCYDPITQKYETYKCKPDDPYEAPRNFFEDDSGILWIASWGAGLLRLNPQSRSWARETAQRERPNSLSTNGILNVGGERSGAVWIATNDKLNRYDSCRFPFRMMKHDPSNPNSLSANSVFSICEDQSGIIWIGTGEGGLNRYDPHTQTFKVYVCDPSDPTSLSSNTITALCPDPSGKIWVGTYLKGLCLFDPETGRSQRFPFNKDSRDPVDGTQLDNDIVRAIWIANDGNVWIGTENGGLNIYDPKTRRFSYFQCDPNRSDTLCSNDVRCILQDHEGVMWVSSMDFGSAGGAGGYAMGGLNRFLPETQSFKRYPCVMTQPGVFKGHRVFDLLENSQKQFLVSTDFGISVYDRGKDTFFDFSPQRGFRCNELRTLVESDDGYLWASTGYSGIVRFHEQTKTIDNYDVSDGIENLMFRQGVRLKAKDGTIYFGSEDGLSVLDKGRIRKNRYVPPVHIEHLQVLDHAVPLSQMGMTKTIRLPYWKNVLSFEFAVLDFTRPLKNFYAYQLEGLDKDWVNNGDRRFARYSKIPPGNYIFRVKGGNSNGTVNETGDSLRIIIDPPFWMRWWFRILMILSGITLVLAGMYLRTYHIREDNRRLEKEVQVRTSQIQANRDYLLHIIDTSPVVILGFRPDGDLTFINPAGVSMFGLSAESLQGKKWWAVASLMDEQESMQSIHNQIQKNNLKDKEIPLTLPSGKTRTLMWSFVNRSDESGNCVEILAFANDITERLENEIMEISGREQRKIGREIHDSLCQTLTGLTFMCTGLVEQKDKMLPSHAEMIAKIKEHLHNVTIQSKQLARGLYLHELENRGLEPALKELTTSIQSLFNVRCDFSSEGLSTIDNLETATHLYRIAQEALSNAVKHSQADQILLRIVSESRQTTLVIKDNGKGFEVNNEFVKKGMGLGIMINRARMINASLTIDSQPEQGTEIRCLLRTAS